MRDKTPLLGVVIRLVVAMGIAFCVGACLGEGENRQRRRLEMNDPIGDSRHVAARVDGRAVYIDELRRLVDETDGGLTKEEALNALIDNELLFGKAFTRRFDSFPEVELERRAALARACLRTQIEEGITERNFDEKRLKKAYLARRDRYVHDVLRRVSHAVVLTGKDGYPTERARLIALDFYHNVQNERVESDFLLAARKFESAHVGKIKVESLPPFPQKKSGLEEPFVEAVFAPKSVHAVTRPQKTKFGWHVIFLAEELPAKDRSFSEVRDELARELLPLEKQFRAQQMLKNLRAKTDVFVYENRLVKTEQAP